jgi:hypothetical protein
MLWGAFDLRAEVEEVAIPMMGSSVNREAFDPDVVLAGDG